MKYYINKVKFVMLVKRLTTVDLLHLKMHVPPQNILNNADIYSLVTKEIDDWQSDCERIDSLFVYVYIYFLLTSLI